MKKNTIMKMTRSIDLMNIAALTGIIANAILPGNEYVFHDGKDSEKDQYQTYKL